MKSERLKILQEQSKLRYLPAERHKKAKIVKIKPAKESVPRETKSAESPVIDFEKVKYWAKRR